MDEAWKLIKDRDEVHRELERRHLGPEDFEKLLRLKELLDVKQEYR